MKMEKKRIKSFGVFMCTVLMSLFCMAGLGIAKSSAPVQFQSNKNLCIPLGNAKLNPPQSIEAKRKAVNFPHSTHFMYKCQECHHTWNGSTSKISGCMTKGCHDQLKPPKNALKNGEFTPEANRYFKYAYHNKCRKCHLELKRENEKMKNASPEERQNYTFRSGPTACRACHPK